MNDDGCLGVTPENLYALFSFYRIRMLHLLEKKMQICSVCVCEGIVFSDIY